MNRRSFLRRTGTTLAVVAAAPMLKFIPAPPVDAVLGEYRNYTSFSDLAIAESIDKAVQDSAMQLDYRAGLRINFLVSQPFGN
jgi:hypothetical protein